MLIVAMVMALAGLMQACGGDEFSTAEGGNTGAAGTSGSSGASGSGGSGGKAGSGGVAGSGGSSGSGGTVADAGDEDAADAADAVAEDATPDVADAVAEDATPDSSDAAEEPDASWPTSPCGAYPPTGYAICWVYDHPSYPGLHMGLAGGVAGPGHFIESEWKDPMVGNAGNCVAATGTQNNVLCTVDDQSIGTVVMFAGGLHQSQSSSTESNNWACDLQKCYGEVYAYHDGVEIGKYVNFQSYGKVHTVMHFVANTHIDLAFNIP
jgi:hypothetical protein